MVHGGSEPTRLPGSLVRWYGLGAVPIGVASTAGTFLLFYYNQVLGVPAASVGAALLAASLFDAFTDPPVGVISDHTRSRCGRRHPYVAGFAFPAALAGLLLWLPPSGLSHTGLLVWLMALLLLVRLFETLVTVPYLALGAELTKDYEERTRLTVTRAVLSNAGRATAGAMLLLVFLRATPEYPNGQLNPAGYPPFAVFTAVVVLASLLGCAWGTRGTIPHLDVAQGALHLKTAIGTVFREMRQALSLRSFCAVFAASVSKQTAWGLSDALGLYMATYFWHVGTDGLFVWGVGMFAGLFAGFPFWQRFAARGEKKRAYVAGTIIYFFFFVGPYLLKAGGLWPGEESGLDFPLYVLTTGFLAHVGAAAHGALSPSMLGDVTDEDELVQARRREGVLFGAESFGYKAMRGFGAVIGGFVVDLSGLEPGADPATVSPAVSQQLGLTLGASMALLVGAALLFISRYDLDRARHARIRAELGERGSA